MDLKIKILYKNLTNASDFSTAKEYEISYPNVLTQCYNEELDHFQCRVVHQKQPIQIDVLDQVELIDADSIFDTQYYKVENYEEIEESIDEELTYTYEISLISETKELETYVCPSLAITPLKEESSRRSIYFYLEKYNNQYGAKLRSNMDASLFNKWTFSDRLIERFDNIIAPELQWNMPTFREVVNGLLQVDDCIATVKNNVIDYIDLTEEKNPITQFNYIRKSKDISSYASELRMDLQNGLQASESGINNAVTTIEYIPVSSNDYYLDSDNLTVKTKFPILRIKSLRLMTVKGPHWNYYESESTTAQVVSFDFCNLDGYSLVKEAKEYQTLNILYLTEEYDPSISGEYYSSYQNYCVYYNRGSNEIIGFTNLQKRFPIIATDKQTISYWQDILMKKNSNLPISEPYGTKTNYYESYFAIEYETTASQTFSVSKDGVVNHNTVIDNQDNSWVDVNTQGNLEKQKVNRLGNENLLLNQRWKLNDNWQMCKIGDFLQHGEDKYIAYQVQYQIFAEHIEVNAFLTKDYILKDKFTGVDSKVRTWVNAQDEAFLKNILKKTYCVLSKERYLNFEKVEKDADYFLSSITGRYETIHPIRTALVRTNTSPDDFQEAYIVDLIARIIGNSIVFTFGFNDNTIVGKYIDLDENALEKKDYSFQGHNSSRYVIKTSALKNGKIPLKNYKYVDDNFEIESIDITLSDSKYLSTVMEDNEIELEDTQSILTNAFKYPKVVNSDFNSIIEMTIEDFKDNKEIPNYSIQYEFLNGSREIYFTENFIKLQQAIRTDYLPNILVKSISWKYNDKNPQVYNTFYNATIDVINVDRYLEHEPSALATINNLDGNYDAIGIYAEDKLLIAVKRTYETDTMQFYINLLKNKDRSYYNDITKEKEGEM